MDEDERDFLLSLPRPSTTKKEDEDPDTLKPRWCGVRGLDGSLE
jgi:hypothetical protein